MSDLFKDFFASQKCQRGPCGDTIVTWMVTLGPDPKACWAHYTDVERIALNAVRTELNDRMDRILAQYPIGESEAAQLRVLAGPND